MKITYTPNPLATIVELDEHEQKALWYQLKIEAMVDMLFTVHYELTHKKEPNLEVIRKEVDPTYYLSDDDRDPLDKRIDELLAHYLEELKLEHVGDCTCFAMSCSKCHAEFILGIDTIKGLGKHPGYRIQAAFSRWNPETKLHDRPAVTLDEAILKVESDPAASTWLKNYRNEHFAQGDGGEDRH